MLVRIIRILVKEGRIEDFKRATRENAKNSIREPGIARFDLLQSKSEPRRFVLYEAYRTADDPARHRETAHYATWKAVVEEMMAEPRTSEEYEGDFPEG